MHDVQWTRRAEKDYENIRAANLTPQVSEILKIVRETPYNPLPPSHRFKKLKKLKNTYSRRITRSHRFVYEILPNTEGVKDPNGKPYEGIVKVLSMWTHYEAGYKL